MIGQSVRDRDIAATGTQHNLSNSVHFEKRRQLEDILLSVYMVVSD